HELKESVIGAEVFGRKPDYNPKRDPIVRTEARRLRERLSQYYEGVGANDGVKIELPKGGYVPVIRGTQPATSADGPQGAASNLGKWRWVSLVGAGLVIVTTVVGLKRLGPGGRLRSNTSSAAYNLYLRARAFEVQSSLTGIESSIDLFHQAIA